MHGRPHVLLPDELLHRFDQMARGQKGKLVANMLDSRGSRTLGGIHHQWSEKHNLYRIVANEGHSVGDPYRWGGHVHQIENAEKLATPRRKHEGGLHV